ncbi:peptidoglycan-binding protein [Kitasatospora sp. NPDC048296]|uniref:peptidoglycan-binding protein n=1 Tax=Kitasatospora sp. NPDC048296 TaxID=3364048 RepID=UPI003713EBD8
MTPPLYVPRAQWGAPPTAAALLPSAGGVKVHWIGGPYTTPDHSQCAGEVRAIRQEHLDDPVQHWVDIAYNLLVCGHGYVFEGRGIGHRSGANGNAQLNVDDYAVCAIVGTNEGNSDALLTGLRDAIDYLQQNGAGGRIQGHRDGYSTDCPGDALENWVHSGAPRPGGGGNGGTGVPPFPGADAFYLGAHGDYVTQLGQALVRKGFGQYYRVGPGPDFSEADRLNCQAFQLAQGWEGTEKGGDADGYPGPETWRRLFS